MYAIDVPTAVAGLPTPAAAGTAGFFTDGNPATGTPATIVPADFLNMVMQELINVAKEGTAPLSKSSYTQVRDGITQMVANASAGVGQVTNVTGVAPINSSGGATPAISISAATDSAPGSMSAADKTKLDGIAAGATANAGTVTAVTVVSANGVSASVANQGTTPALTIALGAITPTSISTTGASSAASYAATGAVAGATGAFTQSVSVKSSGLGWISMNPGDATHAGTVQFYDASNVRHGYMGYASSGALLITLEQGDNLTIQQGNVVMTGSLNTQALTCTTFNASSSDRRLKRDIRRFEPRPLHRSVPFVSYVLKENGWHGLGSIAQRMQKTAPEHVGEFEWKRKGRRSIKRLNLNYAGAAYEQAMWAGRELDRQAKLIEQQAKLIAKLEARLSKMERRA